MVESRMPCRCAPASHVVFLHRFLLTNKSMRLSEAVAGRPQPNPTLTTAQSLDEEPPAVYAVLIVELVGSFFLTLVSCLSGVRAIAAACMPRSS